MKGTAYLEKKYEIDENFKISAIKRTKTTDVEIHTHNYFEIEFILSGKAIHTVNGYTYTLKKGDVYMLSPSDFHSVKVIEPITLINIMYTEQVISPTFVYDFFASGKMLTCRLSDAEFDRLAPVFELIAQKPTSDDNLNIRYIRNLCECMMLTIYDKLKIVPKEPTASRSVYRSILYINRNFRAKISLDELSKSAGYSKNYFSHLFNKTFGVGINDYINNLRLDYAYALLTSTDVSVTQVCFSSGFSSFSVFSRMFKKRFSAPPSKIMK